MDVVGGGGVGVLGAWGGGRSLGGLCFMLNPN